MTKHTLVLPNFEVVSKLSIFVCIDILLAVAFLLSAKKFVRV
jgi:hypothetical protein